MWGYVFLRLAALLAEGLSWSQCGRYILTWRPSSAHSPVMNGMTGYSAVPVPVGVSS